jgi:hypothetical protein
MTRLPGFLNQKRQPPYGVAVEYYAVETVYGSRAFPARAAPDVRPIEVVSTREPTTATETRRNARRYVDETPPAIAGERGDERTYRLCRTLVRRFRLNDRDALGVLADWNGRCAPPWPEHNLLRKLQRARGNERAGP